MQLLHRGKQRILAEAVNPAMPVIKLRIPDIIVIPQNCHAGAVNRARKLLQLFKFFMYFTNLSQPSVFPSGIIQNAVPVHLRTERTGTPAEIADKVRSVRNALHCP